MIGKKNNPEELLELALKAGATHAEVYQSRGRSRPVLFEANRLKQLESSESEGCALRLWKEGCPGLAVAYGIVEAKALVEKAIAISQLNPPENVHLGEVRTSIYPEVGEEVQPEELIQIGKRAIASIREIYPEVICGADLECEKETITLVNSEGLYCEYTDISVSYSIGVEWVRGEDFLGIYDGECVRNKPQPETVIKQIIQRLNWAESNVSPLTGRIPILFTPNAATMLWSTISDALNGKRAIDDSSPWSRQKGKLVLSNILNISQQPDIGPYSCPFDDEGTLTQSLSLITRGRLQQFYSDRATAIVLGTNSTGNGFRPSLGSYPTPDLVNLVIEPGNDSLMNLIVKLDKGVVIDQILGGGADISGDFSINVDLGYRVEKGKIIGRVKDTMVAGNVYTALKQVLEIGSDIQWNGSCYTPSLIIEGLSVVS